MRRITKAVTAEVTKALQARPSDRDALQRRRDAVARKLANLVEALEAGVASPTVQQQITKREVELHEIEGELVQLSRLPDVDVKVLPSWVRQQMSDVARLLADDPPRAKAELQRLNVRFTVTPIRDQGRPFPRVEGTGDLDALCGTRDLPSTARAKAAGPTPYPLSISAHSPPQVSQANESIT